MLCYRRCGWYDGWNARWLIPLEQETEALESHEKASQTWPKSGD